MNKEIYVIVGEGQNEGELGVLGAFSDKKKANSTLKKLKKFGYGGGEDFYLQTYTNNELDFEIGVEEE
jgi:hypothetical protein